jgi:hypothetical protein
MSWRARFLLSLVLAVAPAASWAAPRWAQAIDAPAAGRDVSTSNWSIDGATVRLRVTVPDAAARGLAAPGAPPPNGQALSDAVGAAFAVSSAGGDCDAIEHGEGVGKVYSLALIPGARRFELIFVCPAAQGLMLHDHLLFGARRFAWAPEHVDLARVVRPGQSPSLQLFTQGRQTLSVPDAGGRLKDAGPDRFAGLGLRSLLHSGLGLGVVLGLLLLARRWRDLAPLAAMTFLGYGLSIPLVLSGRLAVNPGLALAAEGLLLVMLAANAIRRQTADVEMPPGWRNAIGAAVAVLLVGLVAGGALAGSASALTVAGLVLFGVTLAAVAPRAPAWAAMAPATLFGLLEGATAGGELAPLQLPAGNVAPALLGYDFGAGATAVALAAVAMAVAWAVGRVASAARPLIVDVASAGLAGGGVFWFVSQFHS